MQGCRSALGRFISAQSIPPCLALLLAQTHRDAEAALLYEPVEELGPQMPETLKDVRELASLLEGRATRCCASGSAEAALWGVK